MTGLGYILSLDEVCSFQSRERVGKASKSEIRRWILNGAVLVNGEKLIWDEEIDFPVNSVTLFPNGKRVSL